MSEVHILEVHTAYQNRESSFTDHGISLDMIGNSTTVHKGQKLHLGSQR